jgi:hypothetical protein
VATGRSDRYTIKDDPAVLAMWREAVTPAKHVHHADVGNSNIKEPKNSKAYQLSRLKRSHPNLFEAVCRGELSANAAAIEAGFRKKPTAFEQVTRLLPKLTPAARTSSPTDTRSSWR